MSADIARRGKRALIFDTDASQFMPTGRPCSLCNDRQSPDRVPMTFIRVREKLGDHSEDVAMICADCLARACIQAERIGLWSQVSAAVRSALDRVLAKKRTLAVR